MATFVANLRYMFLNGLKVKSILRKLKEENSYRSPVTVGNKLQSIGIIEGEIGAFNRTKVKELCKLLGVKEDRVHFMSFVKKKKKEQLEDKTLFSARDIGWKGVFKTPQLKEFKAKNFDLLINYYTERNIALNAVSTLVNSKFKVGLREDMYQINDLIVSVNMEETDVVIREIIKYLEILKIR